MGISTYIYEMMQTDSDGERNRQGHEAAQVFSACFSLLTSAATSDCIVSALG
jgi:hypothetical protein